MLFVNILAYVVLKVKKQGLIIKGKLKYKHYKQLGKDDMLEN